VRIWNGVPLVCSITETEAYIGRMDKACHAYGYRRTPRTETLFAPPGTAYLYLIYGMYHCLNFVTEEEGEPCAVLIRGARPVEGVEFLARNRFGKGAGDLSPYQQRNFLNGPGKLCKALDLTRAQNGLDLTGEALYVLDAGHTPQQVKTGPRVGIDYAEEAVHFPWRFYL
jgi:DNA-3-methyladenine glycosylase